MDFKDIFSLLSRLLSNPLNTTVVALPFLPALWEPWALTLPHLSSGGALGAAWPPSCFRHFTQSARLLPAHLHGTGISTASCSWFAPSQAEFSFLFLLLSLRRDMLDDSGELKKRFMEPLLGFGPAPFGIKKV